METSLTGKIRDNGKTGKVSPQLEGKVRLVSQHPSVAQTVWAGHVATCGAAMSCTSPNHVVIGLAVGLSEESFPLA